MSSTDKTTNYQLSQFVGTDIPSILNDYNGDMRKIDSAIKEASVAGGDNATAIAELQATTGRLSTEVGGINTTVNSLSGRVIGIEGKIPSNASEQNKLVTAEDIAGMSVIEEMQEQIDDIASDLSHLSTRVEGVNDMVIDLQNITSYLNVYESDGYTNNLVTELENAINALKTKYSDSSMNFIFKKAMLDVKIELIAGSDFYLLTPCSVANPTNVTFGCCLAEGMNALTQLSVDCSYNNSSSSLSSCTSYLWKITTSGVTHEQNPTDVMDNAHIKMYAKLTY